MLRAADCIDINDVSLCLYLQTLLRELDFKKPQLDELVNSAESLKAAEANKVQLQNKGERDSSNLSSIKDSLVSHWRLENCVWLCRLSPLCYDI